MPSHSIYALCDPDTGDVRYIGRTSYPLHHRLSNHVGSARSNKCNPALSQWINGLCDNGKRPGIILLEECSLTDADASEKAWIARYIERQCRLFNKAYLPKQPTQKPSKVWGTAKRKPGTLTRSNVRMVGIPADLHARIKVLAERDDLAIYELVAQAIDAYEWRLIVAASWPAPRAEAA